MYRFSIIILLIFSSCLNKIDKGKEVDLLRSIYATQPKSIWPKPFLDESVVADFKEIGALPDAIYVDENPYSDAKKELGELLFFDPRLSESGQIACVSCHDPEFAFADGRRVSAGFDRLEGNRNSPTVLNISFAKSLFWDGRVESLEVQAEDPLESLAEMNTDLHVVSANIKNIKEYRPYFEKAFGDDSINIKRVSYALAIYQRSLVTNQTKFDQFISGNEKVFTDSEVRGLHLFRTKAKCINCHYSSYFSDGKFHNLGMTFYQTMYEDMGKYIQTRKNEDAGKFRTPTLREVYHTAPYFHNGQTRTLSELVDLFNQGMFTEVPKPHQKYDPRFPKKSELIYPLNLTEQEKKDLIAFLKTLSTPYKRYSNPDLPGTIDSWWRD